MVFGEHQRHYTMSWNNRSHFGSRWARRVWLQSTLRQRSFSVVSTYVHCTSFACDGKLQWILAIQQRNKAASIPDFYSGTLRRSPPLSSIIYHSELIVLFRQSSADETHLCLNLAVTDSWDITDIRASYFDITDIRGELRKKGSRKIVAVLDTNCSFF